jgi:multiple sugar transport system substrate-binding protein
MPSRTRRQVLTALAAAALAGCNTLGGADPSTESPGVFMMTDYNTEPWQRKWEQEIIPGFEEQSDATVRYNLSTSPPQAPSTEELVDEGDPPEVYHNTAVMVARHALEDELQSVEGLVDDLVAANGDLHVGYPIRSAGEPHIVPHGLHLGGVLHYRRDVYDELGLSVPETWTELVENARVIDEARDIHAVDRAEVRGFGTPVREDAKMRRDFTTWLYTAGGGYWQWRDEPGGEVDLDFQPADVRAALETMRALAQYSPDPDAAGFSTVPGAWISGRIAQCLFPNAWLAGIAYDVESGPAQDRSLSISPNTAVAPAPLRDRTLDPPTRGWVRVNGTPMFRGANTEYAEQFLRYMYEGPQRQADKNNVTMRSLPPYEGILETDEYRSADIYQAEDGYFLDLERQLLEEVLPLHPGTRPRTPAARYAMQPIPPDTTAEWQDAGPDILTELVQAVLIEGKPMDDAIARGRQRLQSRLEDGRELSG